MAEQLKLLQQGKNESDLKLKTMEDNIAKILAAIQPPSQPSPPANPVTAKYPSGFFSQTSSSASTVVNRSSLLANQSSLPQSVERQPPSRLPSCSAPWSSIRTTIPSHESNCMFTEEAIVKDVDCCGEETTLTTEVLTHDSPSHCAVNAGKTSMAGKVCGIRSGSLPMLILRTTLPPRVPGFLGTINNKFPAISSCQTMSLKWPKTSARG